MYPVMLTVRGRRCLVVGGGGVALRKVDGLLTQRAEVVVVAREPIAAIEELARAGRVQLLRRAYVPEEARGYALVMAATDDAAVNRQVFEDADAAGIWVNVADDPPLCTFHLPARVERGSLQLAVASGGEAPFAVRRLRQMLERRFGAEWAEWMAAAARFRRAMRQLDLTRAEQEARYDAFFAATVDTDGLTARVPPAAEEAALLAGRSTAAAAAVPAGAAPAGAAPAPVSASASSEPSSDVSGGAAGDDRDWSLPAGEPEEPTVAPESYGLVSLVGAGPGDAGLLTLRGRQRLLAADAVVYDRLAAAALPTDLPAAVELRCVGKQAGHHPVPQEEINALLVRLARRGKRVVRLKGGDPFVFGRGSEEAESLVEAGVPFEVVPAVTAGIAIPAYAGIPVTHRQEAVRATIVTAHEAVKSSGSQVNWELLAADPHATLLGYMGVTALPSVVKRLLAGGMDPETPAAMVERGTTAGQRVVRSTIAELPAAVAQAGLEPPGLFVIGPTVRHASRLDWFGRRPLLGERLVVVAPAGTLGEELELSGVDVVETPLPVTPAARVVMGALPLTGCIFRDASEVDALDEERLGPGWGPDVAACCLSAGAARRARELGWRAIEEGGAVADIIRSLQGKRRSRPG